MKVTTAFLCASLVALPTAALAQQPPQGLESATHLSEDAGAQDSWSYRNPKADVSKLKRFMIEPTVVSSDPAAKWGSASAADKQKYADMFTAALKAEIGGAYELADAKGPGVGTMRITLLGVTPTSAVAVATRVTPVGLALSGVKSLAGKPGSFSGSAQIAFELMDSESGELLAAAVRRRSPDALDIAAATTTDGTVAAIAKDAAKAIRVGLDRANGR